MKLSLFRKVIHRKRVHQQNGDFRYTVVFSLLIFLVSGAVVFVIFLFQIQNVDSDILVSFQSNSPKSSLLLNNVVSVNANAQAILELSHEHQFHSTIKSCLPYELKKCREFTPELKSEVEPQNGRSALKIYRVALIAPPGNLSLNVLKFTQEVADEYNHKRSFSDNEIEIISTTHVPPYGYGKTHGLTKIIRIIPRPIFLQVVDSIKHFQSETGTQEKQSVTLNDIEAIFRQTLRFHCRLSHVAAHTAIYSISLQDVLKHPDSVAQKIRKFLLHGTSYSDHDNEKMRGAALIKNKGLTIDSLISSASAFLDSVQGLNHINVTELLDNVLIDELLKSKNFTSWPCNSFWSIDNTEEPQMIINPMVRSVAKALSPDCSVMNSYASCFVKRDLCEDAGDAICNTQ